MELIIDHLYPMIGGLVGGVIGFVKTGAVFMFITGTQFTDIVLAAVIGTTIGWILKRLYDYLEGIIKRRITKK